MNPWIILALLVAVVGVVFVTRAVRCESQRDRIIREAHARAATAREVDDLELAYSLTAPDPAWDARRERLWDGIRDEHTTTEGDK